MALLLGLLSIFSVSLFIGVINQDRIFISPWLWLKYALVTLQVIRFIAIIIELAASDKNNLGASPIFELLFLGETFHLINSLIWVYPAIFSASFPGYNVFALSIILELVEEIEPYTFKRFEYVRVWEIWADSCVWILFPLFAYVLIQNMSRKNVLKNLPCNE